jgi:hypothetical protein
MRHPVKVLLLSALLATAAACEGGDSGSDEPRFKGYTAREARDERESNPRLRASAQEHSQENSNQVQKLKDRDLPGSVDDSPNRETEDEYTGHSGAELGGGGGSGFTISQDRALLLAMGIFGATFFIGLIVWVTHGLRDGFSGFGRTEQRMRRVFLQRCERERARRAQEHPAPYPDTIE